MHEYRPGRARRFAVEVVAHHQVVDALPQQGLCEAVRRTSVGDETLHRIERSDGAGRGQRDRVTHRPRRTRQRLKRFVARQTPDLAAEGRSRDDQGTFGFRSGGGVVLEPLRCFVPVRGDVRIRTAGSELSRPGQGGREGEGNEDQAGQCDHRFALGMGERTPPSGEWNRSRQRHFGQQVCESEHQRQTDQRLELVDVAQRRACRVEEQAHRLRHRRAEFTHVTRGQAGDTDEQDERQPAASRHGPHAEPGEAGGGNQAGGDDCCGLGDQDGAGNAFGGDERGPTVRAAKYLGERCPLSGDTGGLDVVEKRWADLAEQK